MTRRSLTMAAMACAAMPGLSPVSVSEICASPSTRFHTAVITDIDSARWIVRVPVDAAAAAQLETALPLLRLLADRLPYAVPAPAGHVNLKDGRRAVVYPLLAGEPLAFAKIPAGSTLAADLGRAIAAIHNLDRRMYDEAGVPGYDAEACRRRHLVDIDRAAETRRVPTGLLNRWERMLDDVSFWRFAPTAVHGRLTERQVLVCAGSSSVSCGSPGTGGPDDITADITVGAVLGWEHSMVSDPAEDLAEIWRAASLKATDTVYEAYAMARSESADHRLAERAALIGEFRLLTAFLDAVHSGDHAAVNALGAELAALDATVGHPDAAARADGEPPLETVPLDFSPAPVSEQLYRAGQPKPPGVSVQPDPDPAVTGTAATAPAVELDDVSGLPSDYEAAADDGTSRSPGTPGKGTSPA